MLRLARHAAVAARARVVPTARTPLVRFRLAYLKSTISESHQGTGELVTPGWEKTVGLWLGGTCGMLFSMIFIGGYTRLSGSGLSMTDWRLEGRRLPLTEEAWLKEFEEYKKYPEYQRLHAGKMELEEFKRIYFVEWFHRMWGRTAGFLFAGPLIYFAGRGVLRLRFAANLTGLFALGLSQAFVGWWMVRSGFDPPEQHTPTLGPNQRPRVSPYRLASHWTAALTIYAGCVWNTLSLLRPSPSQIHSCAEAVKAASRLRLWAWPTTAMVTATLLSGPFVAGNDAGRAFNTWPKMLDDWIPPEWLAFIAEPFTKWRAIFEETAVVQFNHRMLAYSSVAASLGLWAYSTQLPLSAAAASATAALPMVLGAQMFLGIATLLLYVPTELGVAHQAGGVTVLTALLFVLHTMLCTQYTMIELPLPTDFPTWKSRYLAHSYRFALPACPSRKSTPHVAVGAARFLVASEEDVVDFEGKLQQDASLLEGAQVNRGDKFFPHTRRFTHSDAPIPPRSRAMFHCCSDADPAGATEISVAAPPLPSDSVPPAAEMKAPEVGSFSVEVPSKELSYLGLDVDHVAQGNGVMIRSITEKGAVEAFNTAVPSQSLRPYDVIVAFNDVSTFEGIYEKVKSLMPEKVTLAVLRPKKTKVTLNKTGPLGVKLDYKGTSTGAVIGEVNPSGVVASWNASHPDEKMNSNDRIIECDGKKLAANVLVMFGTSKE
ncbi:Cytochrome c oxidase assembly protein COX15, partial [Durusdinium trenchii]